MYLTNVTDVFGATLIALLVGTSDLPAMIALHTLHKIVFIVVHSITSFLITLREMVMDDVQCAVVVDK